MEKEELLKRAQEDNRDGDEREKMIMDKISRTAAQSAAAIVLVMSLLTYLGAVDGEIVIGGHLVSLNDALMLPFSLYMLLYQSAAGRVSQEAETVSGAALWHRADHLDRPPVHWDHVGGKWKKMN